MDMEKKTFKGMYDNGTLHFAEPVDMDGCWKLEITFLEREDDDIPLEANPHAPEGLMGTVERFDELHRHGDQTPTVRPY